MAEGGGLKFGPAEMKEMAESKMAEGGGLMSEVRRLHRHTLKERKHRFFMSRRNEGNDRNF